MAGTKKILFIRKNLKKDVDKCLRAWYYNKAVAKNLATQRTLISKQQCNPEDSREKALRMPDF